MAVRIITDSACDIDLVTRRKLDIDIIPLKILFGDKEYSDGVDLSHDEFFVKLSKSENLPTTSQISPYVLEEAFKPVVSSGDEIVYISLSSKLSGCYQNACLSAENVDSKNIYVVDSLNASLGQYAIILFAVSLRDKGKSGAEIAKAIDKVKHNLRLLALIDTLEYLQKGGRLSKGAALIGNLISIKPVIGVDEGKVTLLGKARGSKKGNNLLTELVMNSKGIDFDMPIVLAYSGLSDELLKRYLEDNSSLLERNVSIEEIPIISIGAAIGTHIGPGAIGLCFFEKD